ncbi:nitroreductase family protein [Olivibacter sp. SDN3]|uniref:nitroreductase family protein n=1 Tax=Olivibacter sp. SDN3 TaxID=2764720 RepID=UPI0016518BE9|nr:nitroreductase family protein [Olivibacter sp. SDN3]QNL51596.1 nitroreductase family protein [Olivibacter sp. SDN3]
MLSRIKKKIITLAKRAIERRGHKSVFWARIYYCFLDPSFKREFYAALKGKLKHLSDIEHKQANYYLLTRNIHRIEKGLLMKTRKPVFAKDYIQETIESFELIYKEAENNANQQVKWFHDVLENYFSACAPDPHIDIFRTRFNSITQNYPLSVNHHDLDRKYVPYKRVLNGERSSAISYRDFYILSKQRRSVRWFTDQPVPRDLIDQAILAAIEAPSACNRQPFEFRVIDDPEMVHRVASIPMGTKGYAENIPVLVVVVGNLDAYFDERDRHVIYIDSSLASMAFMYALETLGLSSCAINWPDIEVKEKQMEKVLKLDKYQRPIMCIAVGYPDVEERVAYSAKRPIEMIRKYN